MDLEVILQVGHDALFYHSYQSPCSYGAPPGGAASPVANSIGILNAVVSIGYFSYLGYRFVRSFVLPMFFDVADPAEEERRQLQAQV